MCEYAKHHLSWSLKVSTKTWSISKPPLYKSVEKIRFGCCARHSRAALLKLRWLPPTSLAPFIIDELAVKNIERRLLNRAEDGGPTDYERFCVFMAGVSKMALRTVMAMVRKAWRHYYDLLQQRTMNYDKYELAIKQRRPSLTASQSSLAGENLQDFLEEVYDTGDVRDVIQATLERLDLVRPHYDGGNRATWQKGKQWSREECHEG